MRLSVHACMHVVCTWVCQPAGSTCSSSLLVVPETGNCGYLISIRQLDLITASRNVVKGLKIKNYREDREFEIENWEGKEDREWSISYKRESKVGKRSCCWQQETYLSETK